jgi:hypothetical protein
MAFKLYSQKCFLSEGCPRNMRLAKSSPEVIFMNLMISYSYGWHEVRINYDHE